MLEHINKCPTLSKYSQESIDDKKYKRKIIIPKLCASSNILEGYETKYELTSAYGGGTHGGGIKTIFLNTRSMGSSFTPLP